MVRENGWSEMSLHEAGIILIDCVHKTPPAAGAGYPYVAIPQMKGGRVELDGVRRITGEHFVEWTQKALPQAHDVILSRRCNPGETAHVHPGLDCALGQNLVLLRSDGRKVYRRFLRWLVRGPDWWEQVGRFINVGAVFDSLKCADIPNFRLPIPPLSVQKAIAHILGTLDDKIELNRRMNETLEGMARAIFKSWFVDFDPVRAKMDGRQPAGMDADTAALFPDSFNHQNGELLPTGWENRPLYDTARFINGAAFKSVHFCDPSEGLPVVKIAELKNGITSQTKFSNRADLDPKYNIDTGAVLYSWSGSPDTSLATFLWTLGPGLLNQHIFKIETDSAAELHFVFYLLKYLRPTLIEIARNKQTTGLGHVTVADMRRLEVCYPSDEVLGAFDEYVGPIFDKCFLNSLESQTLAALRDTLLPRLLSGELRVGDA